MKSVIVLMGVLLGLAGCSQPDVKFNPDQSQYRVDYTQHWQLLAKRTVDKLVKKVANATPIDVNGHILAPQGIKLRPLGSRPYFIHTAAVDSPFAKMFTPLLQEELVKRGYTTSRTPHNALVVNYSVQTFYYGQGRHPVDYATFPATLATLGYVAAEVSTSAAIASGLFVAVALDVLVERGKITSGEAVLTTTVVARNYTIHQASEAFYVLPTNLPLYWSQYPASAPMETETIRPVIEPVRKFIVQSK